MVKLIVGLNFDPQNQNMTASKEYIESLGIKYKLDTLYTKSNLKSKDKGRLTVQSIESVKSGINKMLETINSMTGLIVMFVCILGIVIMYNMSFLSFMEKNYQFATLKVLG